MTQWIGQTGKSVSLRQVTKRFGTFVAVAEVNVTIAAGEFLTLLGPSGSGKTTLLKIIAGYESPTAGAVLIGERDVSAVPVAKRNIGMVFQSYALFPHMTVAANIAFPLEMRRRPRQEIETRVDEALRLVDLPGLERRMPSQLSGGQQQRVAVARAIVFRPDILLMDEPLGALDKNLRQAMQLELKKLHRRLGITVIYVTHDQEEAMHLSDRIVVLNGGRIEQAGRPEELYNRPLSAFVAGFLGECNLWPAAVRGREGHLADVDLGGVRVDVEVGSGVGPEVGPVTLGVRPEKLRVGEDAEACRNRFPAQAEDVIFLGTGYKVLLQGRQGSLIANVVNRPSRTRLAPGEAVTVGFDPADAFLLPGDALVAPSAMSVAASPGIGALTDTPTGAPA